MSFVRALCSAVVILICLSAPSQAREFWEIDDLESRGAGAVAIAHRGFGNNLGELPDNPLENTLAAISAGFDAGVWITEIDVHLTKDGKAVVTHDNYLPDFTCINSLTYEELLALQPEIPRLNQALEVSSSYAERGGTETGPSGLVIVEIKPPSPLCDPEDATELALVEAVLDDIYQTKMEDRVYLQSFSPAIVALCRNLAPDIPVALAAQVAQFLSPEQVEAITGDPVNATSKDAGFDLQWYEIGVGTRLPAYGGDDPFEDFLRVATLVEADYLALDNDYLSAGGPNGTAALVARAKGLDFIVAVFTVGFDDAEAGWNNLNDADVDMIFIDDVPLGVSLQASWEESVTPPSGQPKLSLRTGHALWGYLLLPLLLYLS